MRDRIDYMRRFFAECVCFVIGLGACAEILLPEHHNLESLNYSLLEKVSRHPIATGIVLVSWGIVVLVTILKMVRPAEKQETAR